MNNPGIRLPLPEYIDWKKNEHLLLQKQQAGRILAANVCHAPMFGRSQNVCVCGSRNLRCKTPRVRRMPNESKAWQTLAQAQTWSPGSLYQLQGCQEEEGTTKGIIMCMRNLSHNCSMYLVTLRLGPHTRTSRDQVPSINGVTGTGSKCQ